MTMIRNDITYDRMYRNGVQYAVGPVAPVAPPPPVLPDGPRIVAEMKALSRVRHHRPLHHEGSGGQYPVREESKRR